MNQLVSEFNNKISGLKQMAGDLQADYLKVASSEESLLIENAVRSLEDAERRIHKAVLLEQKRSA